MSHQSNTDEATHAPGPDGDAASRGHGAPSQADAATATVGAPEYEKCSTELVFDDPESTDEFGPHQRLADAIADLIINNDRSVAIGLEGGWGSGKSTVIKLLARPLKGYADKYALLTFDAWAHEGDPLRRTFIESVAAQLKARGEGERARWVDPEKWEKKLDEISKRSTVEESKNTPAITWWDKALIVSLLFIPLGSALIAAALREDVTLRLGGSPALKFIWEMALGLVLALAPLAVTLVRKWRGEDTSNVWTLILNKGVTEARVETLKTAEPTSIEFEKAFIGLMGEALADPDRKIILVIDNLDRVDAEDALSIWSTLQTFLQHKPNPDYEWLNRLWTVVLYDPKGLSSLWNGTAGGAGDAPQDVCKSFLNKTFQIRFDVPPPVLSEWRDFLIKQLTHAFPDHPPKDRHAVYRVRALHHVSHAPTVRELKLFVNQIGALHRQWARGGARAEDEFSLSHIAYFALVRESMQDVAAALLRGSVPDNQYRSLLGEEVSRSLASLSFNVEKDKGYQMLLGSPIRNAIAEGDAPKLKKLAEVDGFWEVLEGQISKEWVGGGEAVNVARAASALDRSGILIDPDRHEAETIIESLCAAAEQAGSWPYAKQAELTHGIAALVLWRAGRAEDKGKRFATSVIKAMTQGGLNISRESHNTFDSFKWRESVRSVLKGGDGLDLSGLYSEAVVEPMSSALKRTSPVMVREVIFCLEVLYELSGDKDAGEAAAGALRELANDPNLLKQVNGSSEYGSYPLALVLRLILTYKPDESAGEEISAELAGQREQFLRRVFKDQKAEIADQFLNILIRDKRLGLLFEILGDGAEARDFVISCLRHLIDSKLELAGALFTPEVLTQHYNLLIIPDEENIDRADRLIDHLIKTTPLLEYICQHPFDEKLVWLYIRIANKTADAKFVNWVGEFLNGVDEGRWREELSRETSLIFLVQSLGRVEGRVLMGEAFKSALLKTAADIAGGDFTPEHVWLYEGLISSLGQGEAREGLRRELIRIALERGGNTHPSFFELFGKEISGVVSDPQVFSKLFLPLYKAYDYAAIGWIGDMLETSDLSPHWPTPPEGFSEFRGLMAELERQGAKDPNLTVDIYKQLKRIIKKLSSATPPSP